MACQVSGAVVAAVSAMTVELGRRLAPVIVEKGGKVSFVKGCNVLFLICHPSRPFWLNLFHRLISRVSYAGVRGLSRGTSAFARDLYGKAIVTGHRGNSQGTNAGNFI